MKLRLLGAACVIFGLLVAGPVNSKDLISSELLSHCKAALRTIDGVRPESATDNALSAGVCSGYIAGVLAGVDFTYGYVNHIFKERFAKFEGLLIPWNIPSEVKYDQVMRVIVKHLEERPETLHEPASDAVIAALFYAFPNKRE